MGNDGADKRKFRRIFFSREQDVNAVLARSDTHDEDLRIKILNLSEGGLFFTINKEKVGEVKVGDIIILQAINGPDFINISQGIAMAIKWVNDDPFLENIGYGCEFIDLSQRQEALIRDMVASYVIESNEE